MGSMIAASGTPISIHCPKPMDTPYVSAMKPARSALGGVPIRVAAPPMLAA